MVDPAWLRRQIGVVLQENVLFNTTMRMGLCSGLQHLKGTRRRAAKMAAPLQLASTSWQYRIIRPM
jgi:ABC-type bacteriocin/lantibiotic exporter with double-glycine peptidase domain